MNVGQDDCSTDASFQAEALRFPNLLILRVLARVCRSRAFALALNPR